VGFVARVLRLVLHSPSLSQRLSDPERRRRKLHAKEPCPPVHFPSPPTRIFPLPPGVGRGEGATPRRAPLVAESPDPDRGTKSRLLGIAESSFAGRNPDTSGSPYWRTKSRQVGMPLPALLRRINLPSSDDMSAAALSYRCRPRPRLRAKILKRLEKFDMPSLRTRSLTAPAAPATASLIRGSSISL